MSNTPWNAVLEQYAKIKNPQRDLPKGVHLLSSDSCLTIFDGYEKAKFHFLVMPRDPFRLDPSTSTSASSSTVVTSSHLTSLGQLRKSPYCLQVLRELEKQADEVKDMIEEEMVKKDGWKWPIYIGFHAVESMRHVHLHVISSDLISPKLKNKKHYNSFHPKLGFFLHLKDVIDQVSASQPDTRSAVSYERLLKEPLQSHYTGEEFPTIPRLKEHLEHEWIKASRGGKRRQTELEASGTATTKKRKEGEKTTEQPEAASTSKKAKVEESDSDGYETP